MVLGTAGFFDDTLYSVGRGGFCISSLATKSKTSGDI